MTILSVLALVLLPLFSHAEYRVFVLKISRTTAGTSANAASDTPSAGQDFRLVESTLDHIQYSQYYPVAADETVTYIDTWRCSGRTDGFAPHCSNPKGQIQGATPSVP